MAAKLCNARRKIKSKALRLLGKRLKHQCSKLLILPGEIRNKIYAFALGGDVYRLKPLIDPNSYPKPPPDRPVGFIQVCPHPLGLLLTCRQVYQEARLYPFKSNTFSLSSLRASLSLLTP